MKDTLLTDRQMEVLRLRKQGQTQQMIADKLGTSKANICTIEKSANENIRRARETLEFLYTLDASELCILESGTDLMAAPKQIYSAAGSLHIKIKPPPPTVESIKAPKNPPPIKVATVTKSYTGVYSITIHLLQNKDTFQFSPHHIESTFPHLKAGCSKYKDNPNLIWFYSKATANDPP